MKRLLRRFGWWLAGLLLLLVIGGILIVAWRYPHELLTVDSGDVKGDVLIVLGGGTDERPMRAAELYHDGAAPLILVTGYGDTDRNIAILQRLGVPASAILREKDALSTRDNARLSIPLLKAKGVRRAILVTSWYHSRRALACFRRAAPDIDFFSRPAYRTYPPAEWSRHGTSQYIRNEYLKILGYWLCYGIPPW